MKAWIGEKRKDGKYPVTYNFNNGKQFKRVIGEREAANLKELAKTNGDQIIFKEANNG